MSDLVMEATGIAKDLGHGAGQIRALKGVDLALKGGQLTLLMGPSGSGKTTLLSILGCMLTPTEGTVRVRGDSIAGKNPAPEVGPPASGEPIRDPEQRERDGKTRG